jgi:hypothetical protein
VAKFRGLHVVAGIAAMVVAAMLGSAMKLTNTAVVMSSCVVFVAVAMWADSALTRRRRQSLTLQQAASLEQATSLEPTSSLEQAISLEPAPVDSGRETAPPHHRDIGHHPAAEHQSAPSQDGSGVDPRRLDPPGIGGSPGKPSKREGNAA